MCDVHKRGLSDMFPIKVDHEVPRAYRRARRVSEQHLELFSPLTKNSSYNVLLPRPNDQMNAKHQFRKVFELLLLVFLILSSTTQSKGVFVFIQHTLSKIAANRLKLFKSGLLLVLNQQMIFSELWKLFSTILYS